jgi:hypothetical protein
LCIPDAFLVTGKRYRDPDESPVSGEEGGGKNMAETAYELAKQRLGPCGVHCGKCFAFAGGDICTLSSQLVDSLGNFEVYARRFAELMGEPVFLKYPDFREFLGYLAAAECGGCREEKCKLFKGCKVRSCSEGKKVDFCFQCGKFPCGNTGFDEHLYKRHVEINNRMREIGVEAYYEEVKDRPRY